MPVPLLAPLIVGLTAGFSRLIASRIGMWAVTVLGFLGLSLATQSFALGPITDAVGTNMGGITGDLAQWLGVLRLDAYVSTIISAYTVATVKRAFLARRAG